MKKLTSALEIKNLAIKYDVNASGTDLLAKAIEAGEIKQLLQECADAMYAGDMRPVLAQFNRNLSSQRSTRNVIDTASKNRADMVELLWAMTHECEPGERKPRAGFRYTKEEVDSLVAAGNVDELQRFYNNIHSMVSKSISGLAMSQLNDIQRDRMDVKEYASEQLSTLKAKLKGKTSKVKVSDELMTKLEHGKGNLSKAQIAELLKVLKG